MQFVSSDWFTGHGIRAHILEMFEVDLKHFFSYFCNTIRIPSRLLSCWDNDIVRTNARSWDNCQDSAGQNSSVS